MWNILEGNRLSCGKNRLAFILTIELFVLQTAPVSTLEFLAMRSPYAMRKTVFLLHCAILVSFSFSASAAADQFSGVVVFREAGFPTADSAASSPQWIDAVFPGAHFSTAEDLPALLIFSAEEIFWLWAASRSRAQPIGMGVAGSYAITVFDSPVH